MTNPIDLTKDGKVDAADAKFAFAKLMFWKQAYPFLAGVLVGAVGALLVLGLR